jgi:hypothetical protein
MGELFVDGSTLWTDRDAALWHTCELAMTLAAGERPGPTYQAPSAFPPRFATDETFWVSGGFALSRWFAPGDGSYESRTTFIGGGGLLGVALGAATLTGSAVGNARRRRAAAEAAIPRWNVVDQGFLWVTERGVYLQSLRAGVTAWDWWSIHTAEMVAPATVQLQADGTDPFLIASDWAELVFVVWALARFPQHHQLVAGTWLPPGWLAHAAAHHPTRLRSPQLSLGA